VQLGLLAAVAALLLGDGAFAWWQSARLGRNAEAVRVLLDQAEDALHAGDADRAEVALQAADKRAAEGGAGRLAGRMQGLQRDLELLRELDEVDLFRWTREEDKLPEAAAVAARFREVLGRFGMSPDVGGPPRHRRGRTARRCGSAWWQPWTGCWGQRRAPRCGRHFGRWTRRPTATPWHNRRRIFAAAAEAMRRILVENPRRQHGRRHGHVNQGGTRRRGDRL
jgi:hypothetical protein